MNHHFQLPNPLHLGMFNGAMAQPLPGPSQPQLSPASQLKCPECHQTFEDVVSLYAHAAHTHYWNILASLFMSDFLLVKGKCSVCPKGSVLKSGNSFRYSQLSQVLVDQIRTIYLSVARPNFVLAIIKSSEKTDFIEHKPRDQDFKPQNLDNSWAFNQRSQSKEKPESWLVNATLWYGGHLIKKISLGLAVESYFEEINWLEDMLEALYETKDLSKLDQLH